MNIYLLFQTFTLNTNKMSKLEEIKHSKYFTSLSEAEQKTLAETFAKWPVQQQEEFISEMTKLDNGSDTTQLVEDLESTMKNLEESEAGAMHEEEHDEKKEEMEEAEEMLNQL